MLATTPKVRPIIGRMGGKVRLAPWIIQHLTRFQWSIFVEPFCGSAAVYFRMVSDGIFDQIRDRGHHPRVVLNDLDSKIVNLFKVCRDSPELLAHAIEFTPYSREEYRLAQEDLEELGDEVEQARRYLVDCWQSFGKRHGDGTRPSWGFGLYLEHDEFRDPVNQFSSLPDRILTATRYLKKCYIENDDAVKCMERWTSPHSCFYVDPPYFDCEKYYATNAKQSNADLLDLHHRVAAAANTVEAACVAVSYYPNGLLDELYPENHWERHHKEVVASSAATTRTSKTLTKPKRTELLLIRRDRNPNRQTANTSGQLALF